MIGIGDVVMVTTTSGQVLYGKVYWIEPHPADGEAQPHTAICFHPSMKAEDVFRLEEIAASMPKG